MTLAAYLLLLAAQPAAEPLVTLDIPIRRVDQILDQVSKEHGQKLAPTAWVASQHLFVRVKDMPLSTLKQRLATAVQGRWSTQGDKEVLSSTLDQQNAADFLHRKNVDIFFAAPPPLAMTAEEVKTMADQVAELRKRPRDRSVWGELAKIERNNPYDRLLTTVCRSLGREFFAGLKLHEPVVFAERPTRLQRPLPPGGLAAITAFRKSLPELHRIASATPEAKPADVYAYGLEWLRESQGLLENWQFKIYRGKRNTHASLVSFGGGKPLVAGNNLFGAWIGEEDRPPVPKRLELTGKPVLSKVEEEINADLSVAQRGSLSPSGISRAALDALMKSPQPDLLEGAATTLMRQAAAQWGGSVIAFIPDQTAFSLSGYSGEPLEFSHLTQQLFQLNDAGKLNIDLHPDGVVVYADAASFDAEAYFARYDREALKAAVRKGMEEGTSLDVLADTASLTSDPWLAMQLAAVVASASKGYELRAMYIELSSALDLYRSLSPLQRKMAKEGGLEIPLATLPPALNRPVAHMLARANTLRSEAAVPDDEPSYGSGNLAAAWPSNPADTPTVALAQGFPPGSRLRVKVVTTRQPFAFNSSSPSQFQELGLVPGDVKAVAASMAEREANPNQPYQIVLDEFAFGERSRIEVELDFGRAGKVSSVFDHHNLSRGAPRMAWSSMPEEYRARVMDALPAARLAAQKRQQNAVKTTASP